MPNLKVPPPPTEPWTKQDAVVVMCNRLAAFFEHWGYEGDADAVRYAATVLLRPELNDISGLIEENNRLRNRIIELEGGPQ